MNKTTNRAMRRGEPKHCVARTPRANSPAEIQAIVDAANEQLAIWTDPSRAAAYLKMKTGRSVRKGPKADSDCTLPPELDARVQASVERAVVRLDAFTKAAGLLPHPPGNPRIYYRNKGIGRVAGKVCQSYFGPCIFLNARYLLAVGAVQDDMLSDTIPHEVAHVYQWAIDPKERPHGPIWQRLMREGMGINPERCAPYNFDLI